MNGARMPDGTGIEMLLQAGRVQGNGGCNQFSGTYAATATELRFRELASTAMGCIPESILQREALFHQTLGIAPFWRVLGEELHLSDGDGTVRLIFQRTRG